MGETVPAGRPGRKLRGGFKLVHLAIANCQSGHPLGDCTLWNCEHSIAAIRHCFNVSFRMPQRANAQLPDECPDWQLAIGNGQRQ
jgi:hypothetical protein